MSEPPCIGFIGIGNMGWPMAANLARARHSVIVNDADRDRCARFAAEFGATAADLPELGRAADVVITMLPNGKQVAPVSGLVPRARTGSLISQVRRLWSEGCAEVGAAEDNSAIVKRWERLNGVTLS